ncbi:MAG: glycosyltransferase family 4 protein [Pseudomonadota bacterium]
MTRTIWLIAKYVVPPRIANVGSRGFRLLEQFARMGHTSVLITSDSNHLAEIDPVPGAIRETVEEGVRVYWLRTLKYRLANSKRRMASWLDFERRVMTLPIRRMPKPDIVIASSLSLLSVIGGAWIKRCTGAKLVVEIRDIWPLLLVEEGGWSPRNPLIRGLARVERFGYRQADIIVGTMPNLGAHVAKVLGEAKPTYCVPMGVEPSILEDPAPLPDGYADTYLPDGVFKVVYAGTVGVSNAMETFFACAERMAGRTDVRFVVVGSGYLLDDYKARHAHLPNLHFAPRVDKGQVQSVLRRADLLWFGVHPTPVLEYGQSLNKLTDYMLSGRPVVASYYGFPSMLNEAGSGSFVPANDPKALATEIDRYAAMNATERDAIGARGRKWLLDHRRYDALARLYLDILDGRAAPSPQSGGEPGSGPTDHADGNMFGNTVSVAPDTPPG